MKVAFITDIHFGVRGSSLYFVERYKLFFENIFFPQCIKHGVTKIFCLGDTFEDRRHITLVALESSAQMFFDQCEKHNIELIMILGNHDVAYRNTNKTNSLDIFDRAYSNIHMVDEYEEFNIGDKTIGMMAWINNENYARNLERIKNSSVDILAGHFEINGFELTKGNIADKGLSQDIFKNIPTVLSGHFHIKNKIGNIHYIGNPFQTNWDDFDSDRGFHIYDSDTNEYTFIKNTFENYNVLIYSDDIELENFDYDLYKGQIVKVLVNKVSDLNQGNYFKFIENLNDVTQQYNIVEVGKEDVAAPDVVDFKSNTEVINEYVSELSLEDEMKKDVLAIMIDLHNVALSMSEDE